MKIYNLDQMKSNKLWYDVRPGIFYGYRAKMDYFSSLKSFFKMHNETGNIWTHLVCFIYGLIMLIKIIRGDLHNSNIINEGDNFYIMVGATLAMVICMFFSTFYHGMKDIGQKECDRFLKFDLFGIVIMIFFLAFAAVWLGF